MANCRATDVLSKGFEIREMSDHIYMRKSEIKAGALVSVTNGQFALILEDADGCKDDYVKVLLSGEGRVVQINTLYMRRIKSNETG